MFARGIRPYSSETKTQLCSDDWEAQFNFNNIKSGQYFLYPQGAWCVVLSST